MIGWIILGLIVVFIVVIVERTLLFVPEKKEKIEVEEIVLDEDKIVRDMVAMIRCKTVSNRDDSLVDWNEYEKFETEIRMRFPKLFEVAKFEKVGKTGLLFYIKGQSSSAPSVCMAHYDVVPVEDEGWSKPAFEGIIEDNVIWGRGTLDTKGTLCGVLEATEKLLLEGYVPKNDLYLAFSGEEEIDGDSCKEIVAYLDGHGVKPVIVLDEGGAVVEKVFPGVDRECALIGIAEKGSVSVDFSMESNGGHASTPPVKTVMGQLSRAVVAIEKRPFKKQMTKPVKEMFDVLGRESNFLFRMLFANLWCFGPLLDLYGRISGGEINALMRTTVAVTRMEGSKAYNVMPPKGGMGLNMRLLGDDTVESAVAYLNKVIKNDNIKATVVSGMNPSIVSDTACMEYSKLKEAISMTWPEAVVSPYLMMACSDSRHYCKITDRVYRFSAMKLSKEERGMIHGNDERIPIPTLIKTVEFYVRFLKML